jgi:lysozyme
MKTATDDAVNLVTEFEGFSACPYQDPAGVWTIGYGSTRDANGNPVCSTTPSITVTAARSLVDRDLRAAFAEVAADVKVALTPFQEGALADFVYNLGATNFRSSTLLRLLNAGDYAGAAAQFDRWDMAGGKVLAGLLRRRQAEDALYQRASPMTTLGGRRSLPPY